MLQILTLLRKSVEWESREYGYKSIPIWKCVFSELRQKISMLTMEKNILGSLSARRKYADLCGMKNREIKHIVEAKNIA